MAIHYKAMPDKVNVVGGPLITFDRPVTIRQIGETIADEEYQSNASALDEMRYLQLLICRDRYRLHPAFYLSAIGGGNGRDMCGLYHGDRKPLSETALITDGTGDLENNVQSAAQFCAVLDQLETKSRALISAHGGSLNDEYRYADVSLPYYFWSIRVGEGDKVSEGLDIEHSRKVTARRKFQSKPRIPRVSPRNHAWRHRLSTMSSAGWAQLESAGALRDVRHDDVGPFVEGRGGRIIRPQTVQLVPAG